MTSPAKRLPFYGYCPACSRPLDGENLMLDGLDPLCRFCWEEGEDHTRRNPRHVAAEQIADAKVDVDRELSEYAHLPFDEVDRLVGPIPPGDVGFICAFSGHGKTTLVSSAVQRFVDRGERVYIVPLESQTKVFRTHLAAKTLRLHSGKILTGMYKAELPPERWAQMRRDILRGIEAQNEGRMAELLFVSPTRRMDVTALEKNARHAADLGVKVFIIDHIDHVAGGDGRNVHAESVKVIDRVLDLTQEYGLATICTSQLNNEAVKHDPLGQFRCPRPQDVYMGGKKRQNAAWMLGVFRTLRIAGVSRDEMARVRSQQSEAWRLLEPNCMAAALMKSRHFGEREGHRTYLRVDDGIVSDMDSISLEALRHGIR